MRPRRALAGVAAACTAVAAGALAYPASASTAFVPGTATGIAQAMQVAPRTGGFAYTITVGNAISDYRGTLAQAESQALDLGLIGTSVTTEQCDGSAPPIKNSQLPQPLIAESDHGNQSKSHDATGATPSGVLAAGGHEAVAVTTVPTSSAQFTGGTVGIHGLIEASGMSSASAATLVPGSARVATAASTVGRLSLLGGLVVLDGLHWTATQRTGSHPSTTGSFTVGDVVVAGHAVPASSSAFATAIDTVDKVLAQSGLHVTLPKPRRAATGALEIPPLSVGVDDSALGAAVVNPILTAAQPVTQQIEQALLGFSCKTGSALTLEDIGLSAVDGTGGFDLRFGGVSAGTDASTYANPFGSVSLGTASTLTPAPPGAVAAGGQPGVAPAGAGGLPTGGTVTGGSSPQLADRAHITQSCATTSPARWPACSNGAAFVAGLLGLVAVLGVGGADWLVTRRRRHLPQLDL